VTFGPLLRWPSHPKKIRKKKKKVLHPYFTCLV